MITINNSIFDAQGASIKDKVYGITLSGNEDITISGCTFKNQGYASILNNCAGDVTVENCKFETSKVYNPIEGSQTVAMVMLQLKVVISQVLLEITISTFIM